MTFGELAVRRDHPELFLPGEDLLTQLVPSLVEFAFVFVDPLLAHLMWSVRCTRREIDEEWLIRHKCLLLPDPLDRLIRHVFREVIAFFRSLVGLHRYGAFINGRIVLVRLTANEPIEIFESTAAGRPLIERTHWA